ncbi:MAG: penicillin-binding protein 2 [Nitrospirae bacterium]|jgi:cell division protein FtsI/penicillin-binding protein 2|nr:penicillin-binding protein 2 [Nitrospirota bacterium]
MNRKRAIIFNTAIICSFFLVFLRLADLMIFNHERLSEKAEQQHIKIEDMQVRRGMIFDRRGREFALNLELESLYCDPENFLYNKEDITKLASIISKEPEVIISKIPGEGRFAWVERKLEPVTAERVRKLDIKGLGFVPEAKRFYPKEELASHIIGAVGIDNQALEGIELKYDKYLKTAGGKVFFGRDAAGRILSSGVDIESKGNNLVLTIDEVLQRIVEKELDKAILKWRAKAATAIMMDPFTGEILALANRPAYNPNRTGVASNPEKRNRAITDCYEPGSTFKTIIGVAALEEKIVNPDTLFDVSEGSIKVGGKVIRDVHKNEIITFMEVIQKSSNVGSIMIGLKLGKDRIYKYSKLLGIGEKTGIDLPGEVSGWIHPPERWSGTSIGAISIGQEVAMTPLQMLRVYSVVANGGFLVRPHIVSEIVSPDGNVIMSFEGKDINRVISEKTAVRFKEILKRVVGEGGTGRSASVNGNEVAGKTGTAQIVNPETRRYSKEKYVSSFVGFIPADNPKLAIIVVIYEPKGQIYGGVVAAPVFREIANQALSYLNVPMEDDFLQKPAILVSR